MCQARKKMRKYNTHNIETSGNVRKEGKGADSSLSESRGDLFRVSSRSLSGVGVEGNREFVIYIPQFESV